MNLFATESHISGITIYAAYDIFIVIAIILNQRLNCVSSINIALR